MFNLLQDMSELASRRHSMNPLPPPGIAFVVCTSCVYSSNASTTSFPTSSMSSALRLLNGRFMPTNSRTGSSLPSTRTMKFPRPGFSLLISTVAPQSFSERYFAMPAALRLNTPH